MSGSSSFLSEQFTNLKISVETSVPAYYLETLSARHRDTILLVLEWCLPSGSKVTHFQYMFTLKHLYL